jgi:DNA ligase-1
MTDLLVSLLTNTPKELVDKVVYLTRGRIYPDFVGIEIGVAEKLAIKALARASGRSEAEIEEDIKKTGDIGETAQKFIANKKQASFFQQALTCKKSMRHSTKWLRPLAQERLTLSSHCWPAC